MQQTNYAIATLPVNETKVIDKVIDVYLWVNEDLNTDEVASLGQHLIDLAYRRATDVELAYQNSRYPEECHPSLSDAIDELPF